MNNTTDELRAVVSSGLVRLRCPDCKVTIERREDLPAYESIECPRCERYIMRMFWITRSQPNASGQARAARGVDDSTD